MEGNDASVKSSKLHELRSQITEHLSNGGHTDDPHFQELAWQYFGMVESELRVNEDPPSG